MYSFNIIYLIPEQKWVMMNPSYLSRVYQCSHYKLVHEEKHNGYSLKTGGTLVNHVVIYEQKSQKRVRFLHKCGTEPPIGRGMSQCPQTFKMRELQGGLGVQPGLKMAALHRPLYKVSFHLGAQGELGF